MLILYLSLDGEIISVTIFIFEDIRPVLTVVYSSFAEESRRGIDLKLSSESNRPSEELGPWLPGVASHPH